MRAYSAIFIVCIQLCYMMQYLDTRGGTAVNPLISFSENIITIIPKFIYMMATPFTAFRLFWHKVSFIINTLFFTYAWNALCRSRETLCRSVGALHALCVSGCRRPQNGVLGVYPSGGKRYEVGGCVKSRLLVGSGGIRRQHTHSTGTTASMCVQHTIAETSLY